MKSGDFLLKLRLTLPKCLTLHFALWLWYWLRKRGRECEEEVELRFFLEFRTDKLEGSIPNIANIAHKYKAYRFPRRTILESIKTLGDLRACAREICFRSCVHKQSSSLARMKGSRLCCHLLLQTFIPPSGKFKKKTGANQTSQFKPLR